MTLDLEKFISNSIKTQAKIQHLDVKTKTVKDVPDSVKKLIVGEYGDNYLLDADCVSFFWGAIGKEEVKKLFNVVDKALGKSANKLTETDFKKIAFEKQDEDVDSEDADNEEDNTEDVEDAEDIEEPKETVDDASSEESQSDSGEEQLSEDDESAIPQKTSYFFLKITLK